MDVIFENFDVEVDMEKMLAYNQNAIKELFMILGIVDNKLDTQNKKQIDSLEQLLEEFDAELILFDEEDFGDKHGDDFYE